MGLLKATVIHVVFIDNVYSCRVLYINLQVMTLNKISGSDCTVCRWILVSSYWACMDDTWREKWDSILLICLFSFHFQSCQACSFVLGFIPLIGEPACLLSQLVHTHCSQNHNWPNSLALNDFLGGLGWSLGQNWYHEETDQMPTVIRVKSDFFCRPF